jgi:transcriptional regulator with XRE-family HTH domain
MKLKTYMAEASLNERQMAERLGCSVGAVRKWISGERMPRLNQMRRITQVTEGKVTALDFFEAATEAA